MTTRINERKDISDLSVTELLAIFDAYFVIIFLLHSCAFRRNDFGFQGRQSASKLSIVVCMEVA